MNKGKLTKASLFMSLLFILIGINTDVLAEEVSFTLEDRDRLIRIESKLEQHDKQFEQVDKRFEQVDKRLEFIQNLMIGMLAVFGSLCGVFVGLLLWDRKTFKEKAKEEAIKAVEEGKVRDIIVALREIGQKDTNVAEALRHVGLL